MNYANTDSEVQSCSNYPYGTRLYMSPEQKSGERCDNKTDMYALGVVLFELWCPMKTEMERFKVRVTMYLYICYSYIMGSM